jgi:AcrR family transcriptional regulator
MTPTALATRRERRIARRRAQILEAAESVFIMKGYHGATTREIARAADMAEGTLYNYFASKRDLFAGVMQSRTDPLVQAIANLQVETIEEMVAALMASQLQRMMRQRHFRLFLREATLDPELNRYLKEQVLGRISQAIEQQMESLIALGIMRSMDATVASWTLIAALVGLALLGDLGAAPALQAIPAATLAAQVSDIFLGGLQAGAEAGAPGVP